MNKSKSQLFDYLKSQRLMSIATHEGNKIFNTSVYYAMDGQFNLYFISDPTTDHVKNIYKNNTVACSIADSHQNVIDKKIGVQIQGKTYEIKGKDKIIHVLKMWNQANPGYENVINLPNMIKKVIKGKFFQVKPFSIKFFNEALYPKEESETFTF